MKKPNFHKTIGILGGMGPEASANLYKKILSTSRELYGSKQDEDYPTMIIYSLALQGFDETGITDKKKVLETLQNAVQKLEDAGVDIIIVACNTVHYFYSQMQGAVEIPILNLIKETGQLVQSHGHKKIGLLCSQSTNHLKLYEKELVKFGIQVLKPNKAEQNILNKKILAVMEDSHSQRDKAAIQEIIFRLKHDGAEAIILGCTELPLIISAQDTTIPVYDSCQIIIEEVLKQAAT